MTESIIIKYIKAGLDSVSVPSPWSGAGPLILAFVWIPVLFLILLPYHSLETLLVEPVLTLDDEAIWIFLEFQRVESVGDLNGKYFGGQVLKTCFYNLDRFRALDLVEQVWF